VLKPALRQGGRVIFLRSVRARKALPQYVVYDLCKSAVETFPVVMALVSPLMGFVTGQVIEVSGGLFT